MLETTHVELNRWVLMQTNWREQEINERAEELLRNAKTIWIGPIVTN
jgi:hypothetical protein